MPEAFNKQSDVERRYQQVVEIAGSIILMLSTNYEILEFNREAERAYGWRKDEALGQNYLELLVPPPLRATVAKEMAAVLEGKSQHGLESIVRAKSGEERTILLNATHVLEATGESSGILTTAQDITPLCRANDSLQKTEETLHQLHGLTTATDQSLDKKVDRLLEMGCARFSLPVGIVSRVDAGQYQVLNVVDPSNTLRPGQIFPYEQTFCSETLRSDHPLHFHNAEDTQLHQHPCTREWGIKAYIGMVITVGGNRYGTINFSSREKSPRPFNSSDDEIIKLMAQWVGNQFTLRNERSKIVQAEKLSSIGLLASGIGHDINNPLAGIKSCCKALRDGRVSQGKEEEYWDTIEDGLERILATVRGLMDYARHREPQPVTLDAREVSQASINLVSPLAAKKSITLSNEVYANTVILFADRSQLMQALVNVLINAVHASPDQGTVSVHATQRRKQIGLRVTDQGPGMPQEIRSKVFDPFFTTKPGRSRHRSGFGHHLGRHSPERGRSGNRRCPGRWCFRHLLVPQTAVILKTTNIFFELGSQSSSQSDVHL